MGSVTVSDEQREKLIRLAMCEDGQWRWAVWMSAKVYEEAGLTAEVIEGDSVRKLVVASGNVGRDLECASAQHSHAGVREACGRTYMLVHEALTYEDHADPETAIPRDEWLAQREARRLEMLSDVVD